MNARQINVVCVCARESVCVCARALHPEDADLNGRLRALAGAAHQAFGTRSILNAPCSQTKWLRVQAPAAAASPSPFLATELHPILLNVDNMHACLRLFPLQHLRDSYRVFGAAARRGP